MASKKNLKKDVNYITGDLFIRCWIQQKHVSETNKEAATALMMKILSIQNDFVKRINHPEPGNIKGFYKKLRTDFLHQVDSIFKEICELN